MAWPRRRGKFNNVPKRCRQGKTHHSTLEAAWCDALHMREAAGDIKKLVAHPQPRYHLDIDGVHICTYIPDFAWEELDGTEVVADAKGIVTTEYKLKARLMLAIHGIEVLELLKSGLPGRGGR
jgi:hypothetical protein